VLIVDPRETVCRVRSFLFEQRGYKAVSASTVKEALAAVAGTAFDLVIASHQDGVFDGNELGHQIRLQKSLTPVLLIGGPETITPSPLYGETFLAYGTVTPLEVIRQARMLVRPKKG
jgi:DNA-binding response OmpR family regulator